jgi:cytochrome c553
LALTFNVLHRKPIVPCPGKIKTIPQARAALRWRALLRQLLVVPAAAALALIGTLRADAASGEGLLTSKEQAAARKIYVAKCAKCHRFYEPKQYSEAEWQRWIGSMSGKSKLKPDQKKLLTQYLNDYRAGKIEKTH